MPSESVPWDRREAFPKDRKQEKCLGLDGIGGGDAGGGGSCSTSRWREPYHGLRDCPRASPRRPLTGHYRYDGGYHPLYPEESGGQGCTPSRSGDKFCQEEENFRSSSGRSGGGSRSSSSGGREGRFSCRRSPCLESSGDYSRPHHFSPVTAQRSVAVPITYTSFSSSSPIPLKTFVDKSDGGGIDGLGTGQRYDRDHSLGSITWKPLKWTRPSSLSLSKTLRPDSEETSPEISLTQVKQSPVNSPVMSNFSSDDRASSKKPRLGWGQGLAKYEKQKVEGAVDVSGQSGYVQSINCVKDFALNSSPMLPALLGSTSPATPTSANCSSSPACADEKLSIKVLTETDRNLCSDSSVLRAHTSPNSVSINLDLLDTNSVSALDLLLSDLTQPEEACSGDSSFTRHSTLNRLLLLKQDISKELEKTECEIDLFESKLKSIISCDSLKNDYEVHSFNLVNKAESSSKMLSSENSLLASSTGLDGRQIEHNNLLEDETKDRNVNSSGTIICAVQLPCSDRENVNSSNLQSDLCPFNNIDEKSKFPDAEPQIHPDMHLLGDAYSLRPSCGEHIMNIISNIWASNKDTATRASQIFDMTMLPGVDQSNLWETDKTLQWRKHSVYIRGKLAAKMRMTKFKEHVLTLKFRALHHLWREDLNLLFLRRNRPKSNIRLPQLALQKHRSSVRSRYALPAAVNPTLVPTTEILNFTCKLLSDSPLKFYRNNLKMPAQIIDEREKNYSRFNSNNCLIEDPTALEKERKMINPWVQEENNIFLEMLATFGKDFRKISSFIPCKTTADCIEFYYKNHKLESFTEVKRQLKLRKQWQSRNNNTYLMTSGTRVNREANATSLELLSASIIAAESNCNKRNNQKQGFKVSRRSSGLLEKDNSEISGGEKAATVANVLAGIGGSLSSDAMSSCVTSSVDHTEKLHFTMIDRSLTPEAAPQTIEEEETCSDESCDEIESADWTDEEKSMFISAFNMHGRDFVKVANFVRTRSREQCKIFFSKARKCLGLDMIQPGLTNAVTPTSDANEGRSGTEDACSTQSCSKMDADFTQCALNICNDVPVNTGKTVPQTDSDNLCVKCEIDGSNPVKVDGKFDNRTSLIDYKLVSKAGDVDDAVEFLVDTKTNSENTGNISPVKPMVALPSDEKLKSQSTVVPAKKVCEVGSNLLDVPLDLVVNNMPRVKIEESGTSDGSIFLGQTSHPNGVWCNVEQKKSGCTSPNLFSKLQHQSPSNLLCSLPNASHTVLDKQEPAFSSRLKSVLSHVSPASFGKDDTKPSISILNMEDGSTCKPESISGDLKTPFPNLIDSSLHTVGGSLEVSQNLTQLNNGSGMIDGEPVIMIPAIDNRTQPLVPELNNGKCVGTSVLNSMKDIPVAHRTEFEQCHRGGDLKLFGQILSHPSSQKSLSHECTKTNETTISSTVWKDAAIFASIPGSNNTLTHQLGELPQRSYGFWDGSRIQTGFSSLPESAITMTKFQVTSTGIPLRSNVNFDYPQQAQVPSMPTEMKFLDTFSPELQKRNGFDLLAGFQQQRRMVHLGVNMVSAGVSDPVAALQMHYSGRRAKVLTGDLESLTGDTGGR